MLRNYFKIAWRNLFKQKLYAFINIGGLAIGLTCFMLISLYAIHEFSYDKHFENHENVHRVIQQQKGNEFLNSDFFASMPAPLAKTMKAEFPEVIEATTFNIRTALIKTNGQDHIEESGLMAEPSFFNVFTPEFISGNPTTALQKPNGIVLTQSLSEKIFGVTEALGQLVKLDNQNYEVTGVMADLPDNVTFRYDFVRSIEKDQEYLRQKWTNNSLNVFMVLADGVNPKVLESKFPALLEKYQYDPSYPFKNKYFVEPLTDVHFSANINFDLPKKGNKTFLYLLVFIACVTLLLASINYMNLSVARSVKRSVEVGLRKVVGARKEQILQQFLGESILFTFLSLILALALCSMLLPIFNELVERDLKFDLFTDVIYLFGLIALVFLVGVVSGSYPALFIASLKPSQILKGKRPIGTSRFHLQKILITGQYMASFILVIGGIIVFQQMQFIQNKKLGYTKDHIVIIPMKDWKLRQEINTLKNIWESHTNIIKVSSMSNLPTSIQSSTIINDNDDNSENDLAIYHTRVDYNYLNVFDIELLAGRNFSEDFGTDKEEGYIINETAAKALGWTPEEAIGKQFTHSGTETVIGVVKDFHMHSMHMNIEPLMISMAKWTNKIAVKVSPEDLSETLTFLGDSYSDFTPYPFEYQFLDDQFDAMYKSDFRLGKIISYFSLIALFLASFGLFGLAAVITEQKTKEIGVRKVLGASELRIMVLLTGNFLKTVFIAFLLAIPVSWIFIQQWLGDFVYRISIGWEVYLATGIGAVMITFFTVGYQAIKGAITNPIKSLKTE